MPQRGAKPVPGKGVRRSLEVASDLGLSSFPGEETQFASSESRGSIIETPRLGGESLSKTAGSQQSPTFPGKRPWRTRGVPAGRAGWAGYVEKNAPQRRLTNRLFLHPVLAPRGHFCLFQRPFLLMSKPRPDS